MIKSEQLARVVVLPLSGYINRLQAIASASIVANQFSADFSVCWTDINVSTAPVSEIFSSEFVAEHVIGPRAFQELSGFEPTEVPAHLEVHGNVITLAGLGEGEQVFMPRLQTLLGQASQPVTLVFSAGGNFSFSDPQMAIDQRGDWYRNFTFSTAVESRVTEILTGQPPFIGVHLRYTDRSHETPLAREIYRAISTQVELSAIESIFIASDTRAARDKLFARLEKAGLKPWTAEVALDGVPKNQAGIDALIDWKVLSQARSSVYFAASSFGHEAAVAAGSLGTSSALPGHAIQRVRSRAKELTGNLVNYPRNHWLG